MAAVPPLSIKNACFYDDRGREVILRGINFAGDAKYPTRKDSNSYVDSPVPLDRADEHLVRLRDLGFNCIRWVYTWDALEHEGPGLYDEAYIDYTINMLERIRAHGFYVFMDPHQDAWSRFSGGSGAPLWTLHAAGFDPETIEETQAAALYHREETHRIKMLWSSNYHRLVSQTMFTLLFAGEKFAPKCQLNGVNLGTYLHTHYMAAVKHLMERVKAADIGPCLLGWESLNEPGHGLIAYEDIEVHPRHHYHVKLGTAPTPLQAMLLGQGIPQTVEFYRFTAMGLRREEPVTITPGHSAWLSKSELDKVDAKHKWKRSWPGGCIWALHNVYDPHTRKAINPYYFNEHLPPVKANESTFVEHFFVPHWFEFRDLVSSISGKWFTLMQSPVNLPPPNVVSSGRKLDESRTVYTPHYYDGLTLMLKQWRWMNVDAVGVCRNHYASPILAVRIGNRAIRNCINGQLAFLKSEGAERVGNVPCLISEIGIPYDMDRKRAYTTGYYDDQVQAMDANSRALESAKLSHALWVYTAGNTHRYGDDWCGEDLSIYSSDDAHKALRLCRDNPSVHVDDASLGIRAAPAVIRPTPVAVQGRIISYSYDIYKATFMLELLAPVGATSPDTPTEIFLPRYNFAPEPKAVSVSSGSYELDGNILKWSHGDGAQHIVVKGVPMFSDAWYSYVDPFVKSASTPAKEFGRFVKRGIRQWFLAN